MPRCVARVGNPPPALAIRERERSWHWKALFSRSRIANAPPPNRLLSHVAEFGLRRRRQSAAYRPARCRLRNGMRPAALCI
jgi:hypothetical protein